MKKKPSQLALLGASVFLAIALTIGALIRKS
jgi:hypothetical protein